MTQQQPPAGWYTNLRRREVGGAGHLVSSPIGGL
jgi:hypothetical protein